MIRLVRYHTWHKVAYGYESAVRCAFVKEGRKWLQVVALDATVNGGVRVWRVAKSEEAHMIPLMRKGKPYPVKRALKGFRRMAKSHGISKGAINLLREAARENKATKNNAETP